MENSKWDFMKILLHSPGILGLTLVFCLTGMMAKLQVSQTQAVQRGDLPPDKRILPDWMSRLNYIQWVAGIALLVLNWRFGVFVILCEVYARFRYDRHRGLTKSAEVTQANETDHHGDLRKVEGSDQ